MNFELISILLLLHLQTKKESAELFALQNTDTRRPPRPQWTAAQWSTSGHVWGSRRAHGPQPARPGTSAVPAPQSPQSRGKCHSTTTSPFVHTNFQSSSFSDSLCPGVSGFELPGSPLSSEFAHCHDTTAPFQLSSMHPGIKEGCDVWICVSNSQWRRMGINPVLYLFKLNYAQRMVEVERVCQIIEMQTVTTCWQDNYHRAQEAAVRGTIPSWQYAW